ncbi:putative B3 domain-containing protein At4g03170 [Juglans microcarpa x Juglans regia]|uniref:putative B3 domain-containing protein At4g03170 n=1 Tax=Juglans microcarpa x Juglans regia TaxID=2249226 RepID=UPI001B7E6017|nr:putative B3 domain-containing protein At4g03170 [Juglans microcarpa x Juglans regia]
MTLLAIKHAKPDEKLAALLERAERSRFTEEHAKIEPKPIQSSHSQTYQHFGPYSPTDFPLVPSLNGLIGACSKPFEKQLTPTDVRTDQCRLSFNKADVENFLSPLLNKSDDLVRGTPVTVYNMNGKECSMTFKRWASKFHVLTEGWNKLCKEHELRKYEDFVTVWMFRHVRSGELCFVLPMRRMPVFKPLKRGPQMIIN